MTDLTLEPVMKSLEAIEGRLDAYSKKAEGEIKELGKVSQDTQTALENIGLKQRELADELLQLKQRSAAGQEPKTIETYGDMFIKADAYKAFVSGSTNKARIELKATTVTNTVGNTFTQRKPGFVGGDFRVFTLEDLLTSLPATSNAVDFVKENAFTNNAAEAAENATKADSTITTTAVSMPISTVAHWIRITRQLAADNAALAAYINLRMVYGVNLRVENQIIAGDGTAPNISGFTKSGNYTAHGYTNASLTGAGLLNNRFDLIGKIIGDTQAANYPADAILVNPVDWWTMRLAKDSNNRYILGDPGVSQPPTLFGLPVVATNAMTADTVLIASFAQCATFYNREGITVDMSDSDSDNFTKNLITIRAERRCALAVEKPAAVRYGDMTPA